MNTWRSGFDVVHNITHMNPERRAARIGCGNYIEFWPSEVGDEPVTCLTCLADLPIECSVWESPILSGATCPEHEQLILSTNAQRTVDERWEDRVRACSDHLTYRDDHGACSRCGYGQAKPTT